jgi:hypothetical protein
LAAVSTAKEAELVAWLTESFREACTEHYVPEPVEEAEASEERIPKVRPEAAILLNSPGYSSATFEGSGFVLSVGEARGEEISEPRLDRVVRLHVPMIYAVDSSELDGNPRDPANYARFEICRDIFEAAAEQVMILRKETTLAELAECVRAMHLAIVAESATCESETEVAAAISAEARQRIQSELLTSLRRVCG